MKALIVYHDKHSSIIPELKEFCTGSLIKERDSLEPSDYKGKDLILVVGGDGTFLRASHYNKECPILGINPDPENKVGFLDNADVNDYKQKLERIKKKDYKIKKVLRLETKINGKNIDELCLNEVYIGDAKPYNMFNYEITLGNKTEFQRSSGILVGGPAGSHAWLKSAKANPVELDSAKSQYVVREPYISRLTPKYSLTKGFLSEKDLKIVCRTPGIIVVDSIGPEYIIKENDKVRIKRSEFDLKMICF